MLYNKNMTPDSIKTFEQLGAWYSLIMSSAASLTNATYTNANGVPESIASMATFEVRPPASQNTTSQANDFLLFRLAMPFPTGWQMMPGKQYIHAIESITDDQFQLPSSWMT